MASLNRVQLLYIGTDTNLAVGAHVVLVIRTRFPRGGIGQTLDSVTEPARELPETGPRPKAYFATRLTDAV